MIRRVACLVIVGVLVSGMAFAGGAQKEEAALRAANLWLFLVDKGAYRESWSDAAPLFRAAVEPGQWAKTMRSVRKPLGALLSREVHSRTYTTALPGAPDGEYVVIQFKTSFKNKKEAIETVTPMLDKDGTWRVAGYYIK